MGSLRPALPPKIDPKLFGLARSTWANVLTARRRKALGQNYRGNNLACAPRPAGQHRGLGCLWSGNIDLGHIASSRWPEQCFSAFATWYHGHKRGTHGRLITQFMPARYRTGPLSSLITGHSKFTPIENTKNSCHGGMWTVVFCTRYRPANIRVIAPIWAVSRHLGGPDRAHYSPRPASDCLAHQPSTPVARYPHLSLTMALPKVRAQ